MLLIGLVLVMDLGRLNESNGSGVISAGIEAASYSKTSAYRNVLAVWLSTKSVGIWAETDFAWL